LKKNLSFKINYQDIEIDVLKKDVIFKGNLGIVEIYNFAVFDADFFIIVNQNYEVVFGPLSKKHCDKVEILDDKNIMFLKTFENENRLVFQVVLEEDIKFVSINESYDFKVINDQVCLIYNYDNSVVLYNFIEKKFLTYYLKKLSEFKYHEKYRENVALGQMKIISGGKIFLLAFLINEKGQIKSKIKDLISNIKFKTNDLDKVLNYLNENKVSLVRKIKLVDKEINK